jgi:hypothetical protein
MTHRKTTELDDGAERETEGIKIKKTITKVPRTVYRVVTESPLGHPDHWTYSDPVRAARKRIELSMNGWDTDLKEEEEVEAGTAQRLCARFY